MTKFFLVPALALTMVCGLGTSSAQARQRGVSTYSGKAPSTVHYDAPIAKRSELRERCKSTVCAKPGAVKRPVESPAYVQTDHVGQRSATRSRLGAAACATTYCGRVER